MTENDPPQSPHEGVAHAGAGAVADDALADALAALAGPAVAAEMAGEESTVAEMAAVVGAALPTQPEAASGGRRLTVRAAGLAVAGSLAFSGVAAAAVGVEIPVVADVVDHVEELITGDGPPDQPVPADPDAATPPGDVAPAEKEADGEAPSQAGEDTGSASPGEAGSSHERDAPGNSGPARTDCGKENAEPSGDDCDHSANHGQNVAPGQNRDDDNRPGNSGDKANGKGSNNGQGSNADNGPTNGKGAKSKPDADQPSGNENAPGSQSQGESNTNSGGSKKIES